MPTLNNDNIDRHQSTGLRLESTDRHQSIGQWFQTDHKSFDHRLPMDRLMLGHTRFIR